MIADKLKQGDEIRIIAPSLSFSIVSEINVNLANNRFKELNYKISVSKNAKEIDYFKSSSVKSRIEDIHEAFADKNVKAILTVIGGFNSNQLLNYIDYKLIENNPKILCGYSDITVLTNAVYAKTGLITYHGPHFVNFAIKEGFEYIQKYFNKCLVEDKPYEIMPSKEWSDDRWHVSQENREFIKNEGCFIINEGEAEGKAIGGNLCTFNLLQGTEYLPDIKDSIIFIEDDDWTGEDYPLSFDRDLQSIIHLKNFDKVKGIVIGRTQKASKMTNEIFTKIIKSKKELDNIPVICNADFGHTMPIFTFPIGGKVSLKAIDNKVSLKVISH